MNILVIAAHPDDELLGVGGTICKHINQGDEVFICIVTQTYEPIWDKKYISKKVAEQKSVDTFLKIKKRFNLNLPAVKLNTLPHGEFNKIISDIVEEVKPDVIYTHFDGDINYDHTLVNRATMVAARPPKKIKVYLYETLSETEWGNKPFVANMWVDISDYIDKKIKAFSIYESEIRDYPHPRSLEGIKNLAKKRGNEVCKEYAESFILVREIS